MKALISQNYGGGFGATEEGKAWAIKALHPADDMALHSGIPDGTPGASVVVEYHQMVDVYPTVAPGTNWNADIVLHPNPVDFGGIRMVEPAVVTTYLNVSNTQLDGISRAARLQLFFDQVESYRLLYSSVSLHLDATSTTDSGNLVAAQITWAPTMMGAERVTAVYAANRDWGVWMDQPRSYSSLVQTPGAYSGEARDGCYLPLRVTDTNWKYTNQVHNHFNYDDWAAITGGVTSIAGGVNAPAGAASTIGLPYGIESSENGAAQSVFTLPNTQREVGHISIVNVNPLAHFRAFFRMGFELRVMPATLYSPYVHVTASQDKLAMEMYSYVARRLSDAYPASFNQKGTLWKVIAAIAEAGLGVVAPYLVSAVRPLVTRAEAFVEQAIARRRAKKQSATGKPPVAPQVPKPRPKLSIVRRK